MPENPDPLADLQRQRELASRQLAELNRQIEAAKAAQTAGVQSPAPGDASAPPTGATGDTASLYTPDPAGAHASTRRGCFLYAAGLVALVLALLAAIYLIWYRDRPLIFVDQKAPPAAAKPAPAEPSKK